jgi:hypothetical protein
VPPPSVASAIDQIDPVTGDDIVDNASAVIRVDAVEEAPQQPEPVQVAPPIALSAEAVGFVPGPETARLDVDGVLDIDIEFHDDAIYELGRSGGCRL